jgi:hypothetical protein
MRFVLGQKLNANLEKELVQSIGMTYDLPVTSHRLHRISKDFYVDT